MVACAYHKLIFERRLILALQAARGCACIPATPCRRGGYSGGRARFSLLRSLKLAAVAATFWSRGAEFIKESQMSIGLVGIIIEQKK
jgi:hypothetical protein